MTKQIYKYLICLGLLFNTLSSVAQEKIFIDPLGFNTEESEYGPAYFKNGLVYCSVNTKNELLTYINHETGKQFIDLFFTKIDTNFSKTRFFHKELKTSLHDGPITFSLDQKTAYFSRSTKIRKRFRNNIDSKNILGIYRSVFEDGKWSEPIACPFNSTKYNVGQPSLSADGNTLFVVSDKPGGYGIGDIYYSELKDGVWGDLVNMGKGVNTAANETFPFIDESNKLYFSSDRAGGAGGFDIYKAIDLGGYWKESRLRDTVLNSKYNDFSVVWSSDNKEGFFSSNRTGSDDIYKINVVYPDFKDCEELEAQEFCYEFYEEASVDADSVAMSYQWDFGDGNKEEGLETFHCYEKAGLYIVELNVMDPIISKNFVNEATYELEILDVIQPLVTCPDSIFLYEEFTVEVEQGKWIDYTIESAFIDFGDSMIVKGTIEKHSYKTVGQKKLQVLIAGVDVQTGEMTTNCFYKIVEVVEKQFEDQLIGVGNVEEGYSVREVKDTFETGYYDLELLTSPTSLMGDKTIFKEYADGVKEEFIEETQLYSYSVEKTVSSLDLVDEFRKAHELGFSEAEVKYHGVVSNIELLDIKVTNTKGEDNTIVIFKDILFDFDSDRLKSSSKQELDRLVAYLKDNRKIKVEIEAHTDNVGSSVYNQKLSERRAKSVVNYLVSKKIRRQLLNGKGYGESKPIAPNKTRQGRTKNRRASLKVLEL